MPGFLVGLLATLLLGPSPALPSSPVAGADRERVRGMTISCQTWGWEWGTDGFARELDDLEELGVNWVAIHPYAGIRGDGSVRWRGFDPQEPPVWLARPIEEARRRGMGILIKPHLAYWGSPFSWRGEIDFEDPEAIDRFFAGYGAWIRSLARATRGADAFVVGTELERMVRFEDRWRALISAVREETGARLTYAANWGDFETIPFWDALDAIGIQAYFPITDVEDPAVEDLEAGWQKVLARLREVHEQVGKPVVFTEFGYNLSLSSAREPWGYRIAARADRERARALQVRCLSTGLAILEREHEWLRGAFLWKWFVGETGWGEGSFQLDTPTLRAVLARRWGR